MNLHAAVWSALGFITVFGAAALALAMVSASKKARNTDLQALLTPSTVLLPFISNVPM